MLALSALFRGGVKSRDFSGGCGILKPPSVQPLDSQLDDKDSCSYVYACNPASECSHTFVLYCLYMFKQYKHTYFCECLATTTKSLTTRFTTKIDFVWNVTLIFSVL